MSISPSSRLPGLLSIFDGTHDTPIVGLIDGRLSLADAIARRTGRFILTFSRGADRIELPIGGTVEHDGRALLLDAEYAPLARRLEQAGDAIAPALIGAALAMPSAQRREHRSVRLVLMLALGLACVALLAYDLIKLSQAALTITPRMAYLATDVSTITAPTSGTLTFAAGAGSILKGEPILGIQNARGKTILVDATEDVRIVLQDKSVGDHVKGGEPVLAVADPHPPTWIVAVMSREDAFRLASGAVARYGFLNEPADAARTLFVPGDGFELSLLDMAGVAAPQQLYRVRFRIPDDAIARGEPIVLELRQRLSDRLTTLLNGFGFDPAQVASLNAALGWLSVLDPASTGERT